MSFFIMKSIYDTMYAVVGDTFIMGLYDLTNDETTVQFVVTKDNK